MPQSLAMKRFQLHGSSSKIWIAARVVVKMSQADSEGPSRPSKELCLLTTDKDISKVEGIKCVGFSWYSDQAPTLDPKETVLLPFKPL